MNAHENISAEEIFGDVIFSYSRAQAIEDGVLADLTGLFPSDTRMFRHHVACTESVWTMMERAAEAEGKSIGVYVWDVCFMAAKFPISRPDPSTNVFCVALPIGTEPITLKAVCGPGDNGEPVITIMQMHED